MIHGNCCCEAVRFTLSSKPRFLGVCHCSRCRKLGASEFFMVARDSFEWVSGKEFVSEYVPDPPFIYKKCFCVKCGSTLGEILSSEKEFPVAANILNSDPGLKVLFHEHTISKPSWQLLHDGAKLFEGNPN